MKAQTRTIVALFAVAFLIRVLFLLFFYFSVGAENLMKSDAATFFNVARNIEKTGTISAYEPPSSIPTASYAPLYSFFLFATNAYSWPLFALMVQSLLSAVSVSLLYILAIQTHMPRKIALIASTLFIIEPGILFYASQFYTETLFLFLLFLSLVMITREKQTLLLVGSASFLLGLATLTRPIGLYLAPLFMLYMLEPLLHEKKTAIDSAKKAFIFIIIFAAVLSPLAIRNVHQFGSLKLSTQSSYLIVASTFPAYSSWKNNRPFLEEQVKWQKEFEPLGYDNNFVLVGNPALENTIQKKLIQLVTKDPIGLFVSHVRFAPQFFLSSAWQTIADTFANHSSKPSQYGESSSATPRRIAGGLFWLVLTAASVIGLIYMTVQSKSRKSGLLLASIIVIFFFLSGALSHARYRMPVSPLIMLLASASLCVLPSKLHEEHGNR